VDTRTRILDSARRLFIERGYVGTSLADIAEDVGVTKTAVAYHFHPKERLLLELVSPALVAFATELGSAAPRTRAQRREFLRTVVDVLVRHREVVGILAADTGVFTLPSFRAGGMSPRDVLVSRMLPARPSPAETVRAWAALGAAQIAIARTLEQPAEVVREIATAAALAAYDS
jgi:AcrR family transcriptional regulator